MRVSGKKAVNLLFTEGEAFFIFPFRVVRLQRSSDETPFVRVLVSVPRRNFKKATERNLLKRRMRESWRKNRIQLDAKLVNMDIGLIFTSKKTETFQLIDNKIKLVIERLNALNEVDQ